MSTTNN